MRAASEARKDGAHAADTEIVMLEKYFRRVETLDQIRAGIQRYNASHGTPASAYHETLTRFWIETVRDHLAETKPESRLDAVRDTIKTFGLNSSLPQKRYTFDVFNSDEARTWWIPPDR